MAKTTKNPRSIFYALGIGLTAILTLSTSTFAQKVKVDKPKINVEIQKTPRFQVQGVKEKRDTQKFWIEVEVEFEADQAGDPKKEFIDSMEIKYYITVSPKDPKDRKVYTLSVTHKNIPKKEKTYSVAYMSPIEIAKIMGRKKVPNKGDIDVAVEIRHNGTIVAGDATKSASSRWWANLPNEDGKVLKKSLTPFAPLWWDRYPEVEGD